MEDAGAANEIVVDLLRRVDGVRAVRPVEGEGSVAVGVERHARKRGVLGAGAADGGDVDARRGERFDRQCAEGLLADLGQHCSTEPEAGDAGGDVAGRAARSSRVERLAAVMARRDQVDDQFAEGDDIDPPAVRGVHA